MLRAFFLIWLLSYTVSRLLLPRCYAWALHFNIVDKPGARKVHEHVTPLMGGLAIVGATIIATFFVVGLEFPNYVIASLIAGMLVAWVGLLDDRKALSAKARLLVQSLACFVAIYFGVRVHLHFLPDWVNFLISFLWMVGLTNSINLMDNMDGLSAGISGIAAGYLALMAALSGQYLVAGVSSALAGACLGFLHWNFPPARIFMGDSGAYFLGFWLSVLSIQITFPATKSHVSWMVPIFILGLPIFDTTLVVFSRLRRGIHPFTAGKDHISHRLTLVGYSRRESVLILYIAAFLLGTTAVFITQTNPTEAIFVGLLYALAWLMTFVWMERVFDRSSEAAEALPTDPPVHEASLSDHQAPLEP